MQLHNIPLSDQEIDILNRFLLDRLGAELRTEEEIGEEGILDISELDGFFTAIISGPRTILPSEWLPVVWGDYEPDWESDDELEDILSMMMRHMNSIGRRLAEQPRDYEPLFNSNFEGSNNIYAIVDEWCCGYMKGVALAFEDWDAGGDEVADKLMPIVLFASQAGWDTLEKFDEDQVDELKKDIPPAVRMLYTHWLGQRIVSTESQGAENSEQHVGRDDPCPCGSGKPYRKCCLH